MSIRFRDVELLSPLLKTLENPKARRVLTFAVQDCNFSHGQLLRFLDWKKIEHRQLEAKDILPTTGYKWTSGQVKDEKCIHQKTFFQMLGFSPENVHALDVSDYEGADMVHDLNTPIPETLREGFDFVFDGGVTEHVLSVKDALFNAANLVRTGGIVAHHSPNDWNEHGFVNMNAKLYRTFYLCNGFEEIDVKQVIEAVNNPAMYQIIQNPTFRFPFRPQFRSSIFAAFRKVASQPLRVPLEGTYQELYQRTFAS